MADMMSTLKGILGDDADEKIKNAMSMLSSSGLLQNTQNQTENTQVNQAVKSINKTSSDSANGSEGKNLQGTPNPMITPEGLQILGQLRSVVDQISNTNDSRSNLLRSLRPFMRVERQRSIDKAIRIMNIGRFSGLFGGR